MKKILIQSFTVEMLLPLYLVVSVIIQFLLGNIPLSLDSVIILSYQVNSTLIVLCFIVGEIIPFIQIQNFTKKLKIILFNKFLISLILNGLSIGFIILLAWASSGW